MFNKNYFFSSICILIFTLNSLLCAAQDNLTVVAVGSAEVEKDNLNFVFPGSKLLTLAQAKDMDLVLEVLKSDFSFYKNKFVVDEKVYKTTPPMSGRYTVELTVLKDNNLMLKTLLRDNVSKQVALEDVRVIDLKEPRAFAHDIADIIYRVITGKQSIFKTHIVFVSDRASTKGNLIKDLYRMDFDGANKKRITYLNSMIISPAISQDNQSIIYSVIEDKLKRSSQGDRMQKIKNINLYLLDLQKNKSTLISDIDGINSGATFNKSGDSVYLTLSYLQNADIYKIHLKTKKKTRITNHFSDDVDPHINRDENLLTFLSGRPGKAMIYTLDPSGVEKNVVRIGFVGEFNASPRFSPDGSEIVFSTWVDNRFDIYRIGSDGKNLVRLTKNFGSNEEPWYSPDGEFIVFTSQRVISEKQAVQDMYIMNREGEIIRKISENYGKIYTPRWSNFLQL